MKDTLRRPCARLTRGRLFLALLSLQLFIGGGPAQAGERQDALVLGDASEFAAIRAIHVQLDDNHDGSLDFSESDEFVQKELCGEGEVEGGDGRLLVSSSCRGSDKSQRLHQSDQLITSEELWSSWHHNEVFDWSTEDVVNWLQSSVKLSQYASTFRNLRITGRHLPKIASNEAQILQSVLNIYDSQHKQKIQLRAMDIVLFGPPVRESSFWKDVIAISSISVCLLGLLYALRQRRYAQKKMDSFLEDLRTKENELAKLKEKLSLQELAATECVDGGESPAEDITPSSSSPEQPGSPQTEDDLISEMSIATTASSHEAYTYLQQAKDEIGHLQRKVLSLEMHLERSRLNRRALQELLQQAYHCEWDHLDFRKKIVEEEMNRAQKVCDRIKKRRSSLLGSFHLANSSALEDAGMQITRAVNKMHTIAECFDEYHKRWKKIEATCSLTITSSPSSPTTLTSPHPHPSLFTSHTTGSASYEHRQLTANSSEATYDGLSAKLNQVEWLRQDSNSSTSSSQSASVARFSKRVNSLPDFSSSRSMKYTRSRPPSSASRKPSFPSTSRARHRGGSHDLGTKSHDQSSGSAEVHPMTEPLRRSSYSNTSSTFSSTKDASLPPQQQPSLLKQPHNGSMPQLVRKESYSEAIESNDAATTSLEGGGGDWIAFSATGGEKAKTKRKNLDVIKEEGARRSPHTKALVNGGGGGGGDSLGEESDNSSSSPAERRSSKTSSAASIKRSSLRVSHSSDV